MTDAFDKLQASPLGKAYRTYQLYVDRTTPHVAARWASEALLLFIFMLRIVFSQGWYIVCYALGIYLLNMFLLFLQPKFDPSIEQEQVSENIEEGTGASGLEGDNAAEAAAAAAAGNAGENAEFRPFIRRLPEFKFWFNSIRATAVALFTTCFSFFDIPVFWPILLVYFIILFFLTMRRQIQHMMRYKYLPFDIGKTKYNK